MAEFAHHGAEVQRQDQSPYASSFRKGDAVGDDRAATQPDDAGRNTGDQQETKEAFRPQYRTILFAARPLAGSLSHDGDRRPVYRAASQRNSGPPVLRK